MVRNTTAYLQLYAESQSILYLYQHEIIQQQLTLLNSSSNMLNVTLIPQEVSLMTVTPKLLQISSVGCEMKIMKCRLLIVYHPQTDRQSEALN
jgi:hypothetical protein